MINSGSKSNRNKNNGRCNMSTLHAKLAAIQAQLKAPKNQFNRFGGYSYRSCEDILEAVKPLLNGLVLTITDDILLIGDRFYVKATATISDGQSSIVATAFAREAEAKKGMDESQITGSASSYARKYALNGLLLIDDNKDADTQDNRDQIQKPAQREYLTAYQITKIRELAAEKGVDDDYICAKGKVESITQIQSSRFDAIINHLNNLPDVPSGHE